MRHSKWVVLTLLAFASAFLASSGTARGVAAQTEIEGVIPTTLTIYENSRLTGDVECLQSDNGPCIQFGAPDIKLRLNGFTMTGPANQPALENCVTTDNFLPADGIHSGYDDVVIEGPGLVQRMKRHGIALLGTSPDFVDDAVVKELTSHQNCFSGIWLNRVTDSRVEEVVSVRNSIASSTFPCGGTCITNSHDNRIRRSEFAGNGSTAPGPPGGTPNDFGVGLVGTSSGNRIEENGIGGNINGILLYPLTQGNLIRKNVIAGNPPIQVSSDPAVGVDIRDFSAAGANRFEDNLCITYTGPLNPPPCPDLPRFSGHKNN